MRKFTLFLLIFAVLLCYTGCSKAEKDENTAVVNTYLEIAQKYLDEGQPDLAISILEDALEECGENEDLAELLEEALLQKASPDNQDPTTSTDDAPAKKIDPADFAGKWSCAASSLTLDIDVIDATMSVRLYQNQESGASADSSFALTDIKDNQISFDYYFFWGESGTITLLFKENWIDCTIAENDIVTEHGFGSGQFGFTQISGPQPTVDYSALAGTWSSNSNCWYDGGTNLDISINGTTMSLEFTCIQGPPSNRLATVTSTQDVSSISDNKLVIHYSDDGWGNAGRITIDFSQANVIACDFEETYTSSSAMWGFSTYSANLTRQ